METKELVAIHQSGLRIKTAVETGMVSTTISHLRDKGFHMFNVKAITNRSPHLGGTAFKQWLQS